MLKQQWCYTAGRGGKKKKEKKSSETREERRVETERTQYENVPRLLQSTRSCRRWKVKLGSSV